MLHNHPNSVEVNLKNKYTKEKLIFDKILRIYVYKENFIFFIKKKVSI